MAYFIRIKNRVFGSFDESQLLEMKSKGKITRTTKISENDKSEWRDAEEFEFLYPRSVSQPPTGGHPPQPFPDEPKVWFYSTDGKEGYGPVTATEIEQKIQSGQLKIDSPNSLVWQEGQSARLVRREPRFSARVDSTACTVSTGGVHDTTVGEITGTSEQVDTGQMLRPIAASLGWLMFLKITCLLVVIIVQGLAILGWGVYSISYALGANSAIVLFITLVSLAVAGGLYALDFKTFFCFWKYHNDLYQTNATGRASSLIQANQSQSLFWKWLGITVIANLVVILLYGIALALIIGLVSGGIAGIFG